MDIFSMMDAIAAGPGRVVARTEVKGLTISTVLTVDAGYETAVLDANSAHPVERYPNEEAAKKGHRRWVKAAPKLTTIKKLGYGDLVDDEELELVREN